MAERQEPGEAQAPPRRRVRGPEPVEVLQPAEAPVRPPAPEQDREKGEQNLLLGSRLREPGATPEEIGREPEKF